MKSKAILLIALGLLSPAVRAWADEPGKLSIRAFVEQAIRNHPEYARLQSSYQEQRNLAERTLSLKQLLLSIETGFTFTDPPSGSSLTNSTRMTFEAALSQRFPELAGISAQLSLGNRYTSERNTTHVPSIALRLSLPLLRNALGQADRATLKQTQLTLKLIELSENEAFKLILQRLTNLYYSWALAVERASVYDGFQARAAQYYNQVLQRFNLGIADQADLLLARQNWISYQTSWLTSRNSASEQYGLVLSQLEGIQYRPDYSETTTERADYLYLPAPDFPALRADTRSFLPLDMAEIQRDGDTLWSEEDEANFAEGYVDSLQILSIARLNLESARLDAYIANNRNRPSLDIILQGEKSANADSFGKALGSLDGDSLFAGISFSVPLYNASEKYADQAAQAALEKQRLDYENTRITTRNALQQYIYALHAWRRIVDLSDENAQAAAGRVNATYTKYQQGRATLNNLTDAQDAWARARITALESLHSLRRLELEYSVLTDRLKKEALPD